MPTRRALIVLASTAFASATLGRKSRATDAPPRTLLMESEPAAIGVAYVADARKVDPTRFPAYRRGQSCATCQFIEFGTAPQRGCSVIVNRLVMASGWCKLWKLRGSK